MKVYIVTEDNEFRCKIVGAYSDRSKALEKKMENFTDRDIHECEVED